jgi:hypothetical protein
VRERKGSLRCACWFVGRERVVKGLQKWELGLCNESNEKFPVSSDSALGPSQIPIARRRGCVQRK